MTIDLFLLFQLDDNSQIHRAAMNLFDLDMAQAAAVEARTSLDLRLGAAFTRMQSLELQRHLPMLTEALISYGKCIMWANIY